MIMKKNRLLIPLILISLVGCSSNNDNRIKVAEVTHSLFYAPMYVALEAGYFKEEGLDIEIITTPGADKVMAALLSKDAQIGLMGPEASVYTYINGAKDYAINFAQLTQKDGSFLIGKEKKDDFTLNDLKGQIIIGGRKGGMPEMTLEYVLKKYGLTITQDVNDKTKDVCIRTDVSFDATTGVFIAEKNSKYVTAFEPLATQLEKTNQGYKLCSIGELLQENVPYTCFSSLKSFENKNTKKLKGFTNAIKKGLEFVNNNEGKTVAKYLMNNFSTSSEEEIIDVINSYKSIEAWPNEMELKETSFNKLIDIVKEANELPKNTIVPYEDIVTDIYL